MNYADYWGKIFLEGNAIIRLRGENPGFEFTKVVENAAVEMIVNLKKFKKSKADASAEKLNFSTLISVRLFKNFQTANIRTTFYFS